MNFKVTITVLVILFLLFFGIIIWTVTMNIIESTRFKAALEYSAYVEVVGKRIYWDVSDSGSYEDYIISFKFPDNSVKEIQVGGDGWKTKKTVYDSINEGDIGTLSYREEKDIEKRSTKEKWLYRRRQFISFEKDYTTNLED